VRKLFSISLIVIVFSGSVGIPLYRHTCSEENVTINTLFTTSDHCEEMEAPPVLEEHACCAHAEPVVNTEKHIEKEPCCKEDMTRIALSFDYFSQWQLLVAIIPVMPSSIEQFLPYTTVFPSEEQLLYACDSDPPPIQGRERLCRNCVYRL
jgi:hypothetical protein